MPLSHLYSTSLVVVAVVCSSASAQPVVVPFEFVGNFPVVQVEIGNQRVPLLFDLGADDVALSSDAMRSLQVQTLAETYTLLDVYGNKIEGHKFLLPRMGIGSLEFRDVKGTEYGKAPVGSGHFGLELVKAFRLVLDYKARRMTFIPLDEPYPAQHGCSGTQVPFEHGWRAHEGGHRLGRASPRLGYRCTSERHPGGRRKGARHCDRGSCRSKRPVCARCHGVWTDSVSLSRFRATARRRRFYRLRFFRETRCVYRLQREAVPDPA